jgi:hypothetical protein
MQALILKCFLGSILTDNACLAFGLAVQIHPGLKTSKPLLGRGEFVQQITAFRFLHVHAYVRTPHIHVECAKNGLVRGDISGICRNRPHACRTNLSRFIVQLTEFGDQFPSPLLSHMVGMRDAAHARRRQLMPYLCHGAKVAIRDGFDLRAIHDSGALPQQVVPRLRGIMPPPSAAWTLRSTPRL